jgi:hypothetical protein
MQESCLLQFTDSKESLSLLETKDARSFVTYYITYLDAVCQLSTVRCYCKPKLRNFRAFTHHYKTSYIERYDVNVLLENDLFADRIVILCFTLYKAKVI